MTFQKVLPKDLKEPLMTKDNVNSPPHYNQGGIECIDYIESFLTRDEYIGYLRGNVAKYNHRCRYKGKMEEDLRKAQWYNQRLLDFLKKEKSGIQGTIQIVTDPPGVNEKLGGWLFRFDSATPFEEWRPFPGDVIVQVMNVYGDIWEGRVSHLYWGYEEKYNGKIDSEVIVQARQIDNLTKETEQFVTDPTKEDLIKLYKNTTNYAYKETEQ
jgi:hypothetical protein